MGFETGRILTNYIPDLRDNIPHKEAPPLVERAVSSPEQITPLLERLFTHEGENILAKLSSEMERFPEGTYRARIIVGTVEKASRHPHDFVLDVGSDAKSLYFVDPEHQTGRQKGKGILPRDGDLRPKMTTLLGVRFSSDNAVPDISILRFRAAAILDPHLLKMAPQLEMARRLLQTGAVPEEIRGRENEITFRLNIREDNMLAQSRYADKQDLSRLLSGEKSVPALEGKARSYGIIMNHFLEHFRAGKFVPLKNSGQD